MPSDESMHIRAAMYAANNARKVDGGPAVEVDHYRELYEAFIAGWKKALEKD